MSNKMTLNEAWKFYKIQCEEAKKFYRRRREGLCGYCGGKIGLIKKECKSCHRVPTNEYVDSMGKTYMQLEFMTSLMLESGGGKGAPPPGFTWDDIEGGKPKNHMAWLDLTGDALKQALRDGDFTSGQSTSSSSSSRPNNISSPSSSSSYSSSSNVSKVGSCRFCGADMLYSEGETWCSGCGYMPP